MENHKRIYGPLITVLATLFYHWLITLGYAPVTVAVLFPVVVVAAFMSGLRAGMIAALWVSGYSAWLVWATEPERAIVVAISLIVTNYMVGYLKRQSRLSQEIRRKAEAADELNGNIHRLRELDSILTDLIDAWDAISDGAKLTEVKAALHCNATLLTVVAGWRQLWKERESLLRDHEKRTASRS